MAPSSKQNMFNSALIDLSSHQQVLQEKNTAIRYKNYHFLADLHTYDGKSDKSFTNWTTEVENIAHFT